MKILLRKTGSIVLILKIPKKKDKELNLPSKLQTFIDDFFSYLHLTVLTGEYVCQENYPLKFKKLERVIQSIPDSVVVKDDEELMQELSESIIQSVIKPINECLEELKYFLRQVDRKLKNIGSQHVLFDAIKHEGPGSSSSSPFKLNLEPYVTTFLISIELARVDHFLPFQKGILKNLILYKKNLEDTEKIDKPYFIILQYKCNYLIKKISMRFLDDDQNYLYAFDFEDKELSQDEIEKLEFGCFEDFNLKTESHYTNSQEAKKVLEKRIIKIENEKLRPQKKLDFVDYHALIKKYKDENNNPKQVENLLRQFREDYSQIICNDDIAFNKIAYDTVLNYMLNNKLSLMQNNNYPLPEIMEFLEEIKRVQQETRIKNFFPFLKFSEFIIGLLSKNIDEDVPDIVNLKSLLLLLEQNLKLAYENFEWCQDRNFLAFQAPFDECLLKCGPKEEEINIFIASSFILPINYEKVKNKLNLFEREKNKFKTLIDVLMHIQKHKAEISDMKLQIEENDKKQVEILGIFAAIVLFISANVQIFTKINSIEDGLKFTLVMAYSLGFFVVLIWLVTRNNKLNPSPIHWLIIGIFSISTYVIIASLINIFPF